MNSPGFFIRARVTGLQVVAGNLQDYNQSPFLARISLKGGLLVLGGWVFKELSMNLIP